MLLPQFKINIRSFVINVSDNDIIVYFLY